MTRRDPTSRFDVAAVLDFVRDNVARADAFISAAEYQLDRSPFDGEETDDDDDGDERARHRNHLAHLLDAAKLAVRGALYASDELTAQLAKRRPVTGGLR